MFSIPHSAPNRFIKRNFLILSLIKNIRIKNLYFLKPLGAKCGINDLIVVDLKGKAAHEGQ